MERDHSPHDTRRSEAFYFERAAKKVTEKERQDITAMAERIFNTVDTMIEEYGVDDEDTIALVNLLYDNTLTAQQIEAAKEHGVIPSEHPYFENVLTIDLHEDTNSSDPEQLQKIDRRARSFAKRLGFEGSHTLRTDTQFPLLRHATEPMYAQFSGKPVAIGEENVWLVQTIKIAPQGPVNRSVRSRNRAITT